MSAYTLNIRPRARRALRQLDPTTQQAVTAAIDALAADPRPAGAVPIKGGAIG
jgi:mRNA-degrading endonuclease RelE of RelBE toxin-antitoxin system